MTRIARLRSIGRTRRMTVTLVGTAAAVILGVSGALAAGAPDDDGGADTSGGTTVGVTSGSDGDPTPAPTGSSTTTGGVGGADEGAYGGTSEGGTDVGGASDGGGDVGGSGSTSGGPTEYPGPSDYPSPSGSGGPSPTPPAGLPELTERIGELEAKVDQLPTKEELADALRAFADQLDNGGQSEN